MEEFTPSMGGLSSKTARVQTGGGAAVLGTAKPKGTAFTQAANRVSYIRSRIDAVSSRVARYADELLGPMPAEVGDPKAEDGSTRDINYEINKVNEALDTLESHLSRFES